MVINKATYDQIANALSKHFESLYYVEIKTGKYMQIVPSGLFGDWKIPTEGDDFFLLSSRNASNFVHPDDLERVLKIHDKATVLENLSKADSYSMSCRLVTNGKVVHIRHIDIMCEDHKHILCCMENIEEEFKEKEEQKQKVQLAERLARRDALTGIKNKNAFSEALQEIEEKIAEGAEGKHFGIVMCDVNDLKLITDTRGHSFGDEALQRASRMICGIFKHSPVFRIGGDEFAVLLSEDDYAVRDRLLGLLREESEANGRTRSGPVVASGMAVYEPETDEDFDAVFKRADRRMYDNKNALKSFRVAVNYRSADGPDAPIPDERKRQLDGLFGALYTVSGEGYVFLNDMRYDFSRLSLKFRDDFGLKNEYMYQAGSIWQNYIHPDDLEAYKESVDEIFVEGGGLRPTFYRARKPDGTYVLLSTHGFVLTDSRGNPEYFGGIIIPQ